MIRIFIILFFMPLALFLQEVPDSLNLIYNDDIPIGIDDARWRDDRAQWTQDTV